MQQHWKGGCHCGGVRYEVVGALDDVAHCHCSICRKVSGGIVTTWVTVQRERFRWCVGQPAEYRSSNSCTRYFCSGCGAQLALFTALSPATLDFTVATLDEPERVAADRHIWVTTRLPWLHLDEQLPSEDQERL